MIVVINFYAILATMASKDDISKDNVDKVPDSDQSKEDCTSEEGDTKRIRSMSEKGVGYFRSQYEDRDARVEKAWVAIEALLMTLKQNPSDFKVLRSIKSDLSKLRSVFEEATMDLIDFLQRANTDESLREVSIQKDVLLRRQKVMRHLHQQLDNALLDVAETLSQSEQTVRSTTSLDRQRLKLEREKTKFSFVQEEMKLLQARAEVEARMLELQQRRSTAIAKVETDALEQMSEGRRSLPIDEADRVQRVADYVNSIPPPSEHSVHDVRPSSEPGVGPNDVDNSHIASMTNFLLKKELLIQRFTAFSDQPESYLSWKTNFTTIVSELNVSPFEELQLLVRWLGPESSKYADNIRQTTVTNPADGVKLIWQRLDERYCAIELMESSLKSKLGRFPHLTLKDPKKLYDLLDILTQIVSIKKNPKYSTIFSYYDTSVGIVPIVNKLPYQWREKWTTRAADYKQRKNVTYPPFDYFVQFIQELSKVRNDPGFQYEEKPQSRPPNRRPGTPSVTVIKSSVPPTTTTSVCPIHKLPHSLKDCKQFKSKTLGEKKKLIRENGICYRCCDSDKHHAKNCTVSVVCDICKSKDHLTILHRDNKKDPKGPKPHGGEHGTSSDSNAVHNNCTMICGGSLYKGKSCAKTLLVRVYAEGTPGRAVTMYAIIDEQSNRSLVRSEFFNIMGIEDSQPKPYTLDSCAGSIQVFGRRASGFVVESLDAKERLQLPTLIECDNMPNIREEIPTPDVAMAHAHLAHLAGAIPPLDNNSEILLLIGRDLIDAHYVLDQCIGAPFAQRLKLGWVIIGESCLSKVHAPEEVRVNKTNLLWNGRASIMTPCINYFHVKESATNVDSVNDSVGDNLFQRTKYDDKPGLSIEDGEFLDLMEGGTFKSEEGRWIAPLPFRASRRRLPNNRPQAVKRALALSRSLHVNHRKREHFLEFMQGILDSKYAEEAPALADEEERWYLPIFGIYHPKKPTKLRVVFDSSAKFDGVSLNDVLLCGPDLTNELLGVLLRFRREPVAITTDIEQMFFRFTVREEDRNFLRFLWHKDNDPSKELVEYRMRVHVFGNAPSPAVATYCLRRSVEAADEDIQYFVRRHFYVDDGLASVSTPEEGIDLLTRTQGVLAESGLRLHKFSSNSKEVVAALPPEDISAELRDVNLCMDNLPEQRSLGLIWDLHSDSFTFRVGIEDKPFTRRGILSTLHSVYDPLGFASPVILRGRLLFRDITEFSPAWDDLLPVMYAKDWQSWKDDVLHLSSVEIPRTYSAFSLNDSVRREIHMFSDASETAVACVAYLKTVNKDGVEDIGFLFGKSKVAPKHGHTIPRLELCAAVLGAETAEMLLDQLDVPIDSTTFYTDSRVVLGYIYNRTRRFYTYVTNRVSRILKVSRPEHWVYVASQDNPADIGTRGVSAKDLDSSAWLKPQSSSFRTQESSSHELVDAANDLEVRPLATRVESDDTKSSIVSEFSNVSDWMSLLSGLRFLRMVARRKRTGEQSEKSVANLHATEQFVIRMVQKEFYPEEYDNLRKGKAVSASSSLSSLHPFMGEDNLLRVGGRISKSDLTANEKHPVIIPKKSHVAILLFRHFHLKIHHQGRHMTEGSIRAAGYWIVGMKGLVTSEIHKCVTCRRLRGKMETQIMSDLPRDRLTPSPPFTYVGVDAFGHWNVVTRKTRGGSANSKRWAILFTCLSSRAIHIEVVEEMSASSFWNAVRRFVSIRGKVQEFRSDRGTNFTGSTDTARDGAVNVEDKLVRSFLLGQGTTWIFNPPHSSHFGGAWERMIGTVRRVLDAMLLEAPMKNLSHEVLVTFLMEVCAIVNSRPIVPVSSDPDNPLILTPSVLLTQKVSADVIPVDQFDVKELYRSQWKYV